jgi:hypothetical protein
VRLGDVAEIVSDDPAVTEELAAVPLFPALGPGRSRQLDRHQVRQLLAISGIDLKWITIAGSELVIVQTEAAGPIARPISRRGQGGSNIRLASLETESPAARPLKPDVEPVPLPVLVKRGENVTIHSRAAGVKVTDTGKALADGTLGAEIAVELNDKRTKIQGRVAGPRTIELQAK